MHRDPSDDPADLGESTLRISGQTEESALVDRALPLRGTQLGRYIVLGTLARGGMGVILDAHDPQLDRRVAIKVVRHDRGPVVSEEVRGRVLREARALARVVHRNIVAVYDAGFHGDELYIVMELNQGTTLRGWMSEKRRTPTEICAVFVEAGRGLAAAHAAGLVHRDFKPDNVLLGKDGRVQVADFGLARVLAAASDDREVPGAATARSLTIADAGTPPYMAPEQFAHAAIDARADQFAFCVSLHEALYGVRPFAGASIGELKKNITAGARVPPPPGRKVPRWLEAAVARGLSVDPEQRFPAMDALIAVLARDRRRARRRVALGAALLAVVATVALAVDLAHEPPALCRTAAAELARVWSPDARARLARAFDASGRGYAGAVRDHAIAVLDGYGAGWVQARTEACEATHVHGTQSEAALDLRMRCLDCRLGELTARVALLSGTIDDGLLARAHAVAGELEPVASCDDLEALAARAAPPRDPEVRRRLDELHARVAEANAAWTARRNDSGLVLATAAVDEARRLGWKPAIAEALVARGRVLRLFSDHAGSERALREALALAAETRDDPLLADVAVELVDTVGHYALRFADAAAMRPLVEASLVRGGADALLQARWKTVLGNIAVGQTRLEDAKTAYREALSLFERSLGSESPMVSSVIADLGYVLQSQGRYDEAATLYERALRIEERTLGPGHPSYASALSFLGQLRKEQGRYAEAEQLYRRALAIFGPDHLEAGSPMARLGHVLALEGRDVEAREWLERARAFYERTRGARDISVGMTWAHLARLSLAEGELQRAEREAGEAVSLYREAFGDDSPRTAQLAVVAAQVLLERGRFADARRELERLRPILAKAYGAEHREVAIADVGIGSALVGEGHAGEGRAVVERAVGILEIRLGPSHPALAAPLLALGQARVATGDTAAAVAALERAVALSEGGPALPRAAAQLALARVTVGERSEELLRRADVAYRAAGKTIPAAIHHK